MKTGQQMMATAVLALGLSGAPGLAFGQMSGDEIRQQVMGWLRDYIGLVVDARTRIEENTSPELRAHKRKEAQVQAFAHLVAQAQQGDREAQATVGAMYLSGTEPAPKKPADGIAWLKKAALAGHMDARKALAALYLEGNDEVKKNLPEAVKWLRLLAQDGDDDARRILAPLLYRGAGVPKNHPEALKYALPLAAEGQWEFQAMAGRLYLTGEGIPRNPVEAAKYLRLAAGQGHAESQFLLGQLFAKGEGVPQSVEHAARWLGPAAAQGHALALGMLGLYTLQGQGVPKDAARALTLLQGAADKGVPSAQYLVGALTEAGEEAPQNYVEAAKWYRRAAGQGVGPAAHRLGVLYALGKGVPQDYTQADLWLNIAAARAATDEAAQASRDERARLAPHLSTRQQERAAELLSAWAPKDEAAPAPIEGLGPPVDAVVARAGAPAETAAGRARSSPVASAVPVPDTPTTSERVKSAQAALNTHFRAALSVDGRLGRETRQVLRLYQEARGLPMTGVPDDATLDALRREDAGNAPQRAALTGRP